ncbi:hypothetical protein B566_EDAN011594 [Ephemera danica]|nr:hypothetical protein B566_EDAN011594 [Ephemera danica]
MSETEFAVTKSLAHEFAKPGGDGERLQAVLEERAKTQDNWLSEWWLNHVYLDSRESLPINSNTAMTFNCKEVTSVEEQLQMAASYIAVCVDFKNILDKGQLPQDKLGPFALDMTQNYQEYNTCRIPGEKRDTLRQFQPGKRFFKFWLQFFKLPVYGEDGSRLNHEQLIQQLRIIIAQSPEPSPHPVGILTAERRDKWYRLRQELLKEAQNREALDAIETSLILISLDAKPSKVGATKSERDLAAAMDMTHGSGCNTPNRWSDKILNGVVGWYCSIGMVGEHSAADGHAFSHCFNYIGANLQIDNCELDCYIFADYGSDAIKSMKLSPDSFIQMAIQLAYYRSCTEEAVQFCRAMMDASVTYQDKANALRAAVNAHKDLALLAISGQGVDRHLFGMRLAAAQLGMEVPKLFLDPGCTRSGCYRVCTSQMPLFYSNFSIFGAVVPDGYGICYSPLKDKITFGITAYNSSVRPFLTEAEFAVTTSLVNELKAPGGVGERLQAMSEWWLNYAYLDNRNPVVINSNTATTFAEKEITCVDEQLQRGATYVTKVFDFKRVLDEGKFPQEKMGNFNLDMSEIYTLFATCRVPGEKRDILRRFEKSEYPNHIIVVHNYHFFVVPVIDDNGERLNQKQILEQLRAVVEMSPEPSSSPVGILTAEQRDTWYRVRQMLLKEPQNREALEMIETCLMVLSLDSKPSDAELASDTRGEAPALRMMHGGGSNSPNRWFDKTFNFVVGYHGAVGVGFEHSPSEGVPFIPYFTYIGDNINREDKQPLATKVPSPRKLTFIVNDEIQTAIQTARINLQKQIDDFEMKCFQFMDYGANFIKAQKLSPDSFIQMALQLAFYRLHKIPGAQYESASLRGFKHGRTEAIRSCSEQTIHFCRTILDESASPEAKVTALRNAVNTHKELVLQAVSGQGVDRHLLGLRMAAAELGDKMNIGISAFNSCEDTSAVKMAEAVEKSFLDMKKILTDHQ